MTQIRLPEGVPGNTVATPHAASLTLLRLDRISAFPENPACSGNKVFKLLPLVERLAGIKTPVCLISVGGPWSNHLHALAALGRQLSVPVLGLVRGEPELWTPTLKDCRHWGMAIQFVRREQFRRRYEPDALREMAARAAAIHFPGLPRTAQIVIPEGGSEQQAMSGLALLAERITHSVPAMDSLILPVGGGGTLAGLRLALPAQVRIEGIMAARDTDRVQKRVSDWLAPAGSNGDRLKAMAPAAPWILNDSQAGPGFGKLSAAQRLRQPELESWLDTPLDPVYTLKMALALEAGLRAGRYAGRHVVALHTGGLQGRRDLQKNPAEDVSRG